MECAFQKINILYGCYKIRKQATYLVAETCLKPASIAVSNLTRAWSKSVRGRRSVVKSVDRLLD
jgi:hypothetical protein